MTLTDAQKATLDGAFHIRRKRGQRLKKTQRHKLQKRFIERCGEVDIEATCAELGISRSTFYAWLRNDAEFKARYDFKLSSYALSDLMEEDDVWATEKDDMWADAYLESLPEGQLILLMKAHYRRRRRQNVLLSAMMPS